MIFSYNWLREFVELPSDPEELAKIMTFGGIEVENYRPFATILHEIKIVLVKEVSKHPEADKLFVCQIDTGTEIKQVVCGAPNCRQGMSTAYAPPGIKLGNMLIKKVSIRGVESEGMLCSERDLGISEDHSGIISLPQNAPAGSDLQSFYKLADTIFEVEITPNRPDLLGFLGLARDLAALTNKSLCLPENFQTDGLTYPLRKLDPIISDSMPFTLVNESPDLCSRYVARVIRGVKIGSSPHWLKRKLLAIGINPVNNLVDITNYVMMEFGHPLHAFDFEKLQGCEIRVRRAQDNETISALDHKKYTLQDSDLVIADAEEPVAIAGVIGGELSSITTATTTIVLEAANFDHLSIRKTTERFKISTDSSYRFTRNLSDETTDLISMRAADLICSICGGEVVDLIDSYPAPLKQKRVNLRVDRTNKLLTTGLSSDDICDYLKPLGLVPEQQDCHELKEITFSIPAYRKDLTREIDLIEEVIRLHGYNNIPEERERESLTDLHWFSMKRYIGDYLVHNGFCEAINSSFSEPAMLKQLRLTDNDYRVNCWELVNPLGVSFSVMRTTLIPGLLKNVQLNLHNGQTDIKLYELGKVYLKATDEPEERYFLTGVVSGNIHDHHWKYKTDKSSIFSVKGYVEGLLERLIENPVQFRPSGIDYYQKGAGIEIVLAGESVGNLGKIDPLLAKDAEIDQAVFLFDIDVDKVVRFGHKKSYTYREITKYPPVARDLSFVIDKKHQHQDIISTIKEVDRSVIRNVKLIDEFTGKNIPEGHRSLTYNILFSSREGTLTDETVNNLMDSIITELNKEFSIEMR